MKVLSGEAKTITYLDAEQELVRIISYHIYIRGFNVNVNRDMFSES